jgi:hypothetical protein
MKRKDFFREVIFRSQNYSFGLLIFIMLHPGEVAHAKRA